MVSITKTLVSRGVDVDLIDVELHKQHGLSNFSLIGLAGKSVQEAKERMVAAIKNSGFDFTPERITINLSPSHIPKHGTHLDLAVTAAYLLSTNQIPELGDNILLGELSLSGDVKPARGIFSMVYGASKNGHRSFIVPIDSLNELIRIPDIELVAISKLQELKDLPTPTLKYANPKKEQPSLVNPFASIRGQQIAKRALQIAALGRHNLLMIGPPGCGKTILARAFTYLLPSLNRKDLLEVQSVYSLLGLPYSTAAPPFRSPHHSTTTAALLGGGIYPRPGEVSLAHKGVLFLDEIAEFPSRVLDSLRQPLSESVVHVSRANANLSFPANFQLLAAMNGCKCGNFGTEKECSCTPSEVRNYQQRLSGPLLDRFDMIVNLREESEYHENELNPEPIVTSLESPPPPLSMLDGKSRQFLYDLVKSNQISMRGLDSVIKVAYTISVFENSKVSVEYLAEAASYRSIRFT